MSIEEIYLNKYEKEDDKKGIVVRIDFQRMEVVSFERATKGTMKIRGVAEIVTSLVPLSFKKLFGYFVWNDQIYIIMGRRCIEFKKITAKFITIWLLPLYLVFSIRDKIFFFGLEPFYRDEMSLSIFKVISIFLKNPEEYDLIKEKYL